VGSIDREEILMNTVAVAVLVTLSEDAVMVAVPREAPIMVTAPHDAVAQVPVMVTIVESLLDQETPLVRYMP
jgi:hypothetical protein